MSQAKTIEGKIKDGIKNLKVEIDEYFKMYQRIIEDFRKESGFSEDMIFSTGIFGFNNDNKLHSRAYNKEILLSYLQPLSQNWAHFYYNSEEIIFNTFVILNFMGREEGNLDVIGINLNLSLSKNGEEEYLVKFNDIEYLINKNSTLSSRQYVLHRDMTKYIDTVVSKLNKKDLYELTFEQFFKGF
jgi:hypothetical protein